MNPTALNHDELTALLAEQEPPCLSLYQPTSRRHPENQQDPIRYGNLLKSLEESLLKGYSAQDTATALIPFRELATDRDFWSHTTDGIAVLGAPGLFRVFQFHRPVDELTVVANSFHIKPLLRIIQSAGRYQVLSLNRREIRLFEGDRDHLEEIKLAEDVPATITQALGDEFTEPHQTVTSHGGTGMGSAMRHGHGGKQDELDIDEPRFFRAVDRAILAHHSRPTGLPLILAALGEYHTPFRQVSHNSLLLPKGIETDPTSLKLDDLRARAWAIVEPEYRERLAQMAGDFGAAKAKGLGTDDLASAVTAATQSRVASLLVEAERQIPGLLDPDTGRVKLHSLDDPQVDDLLDDLAELVLRRGGKVVTVPAADMPTDTGLAATFRF